MQTKKLLDEVGSKNIIVDYAMRYGNPSIKSKINKLHEVGCEKLIVLPLYPNMRQQQQQQCVMKFIEF